MVTPSASYSLTMRVSVPHTPGSFAQVAAAVGEAGGMLGAIDLVRQSRGLSVRDVTVNASDSLHGQRIVDAVRGVPGVTVESVSDRTFLLHLGGKIVVQPKVPVRNRDDLSMAYTPGVGRVCLAIHEEPARAFTLTIKRNTVAVLSAGPALSSLRYAVPQARTRGRLRRPMAFSE